MRDYQPTKPRVYWLPKSVYHRAMGVVRDYDRQKARYNAILSRSAPPSDGQPRGNGVSNPVEHTVIILDKISDELRAVDLALTMVPQVYQEAVLCKIKTDHWPKNLPVGKNTPSYWRARFLYFVAKYLELIE